MKKLLLLVIPLLFTSNVYALNDHCFMKTSEHMDTGVLKDGCKVCNQFDDDGNKINCIGESLPMNIRVEYGNKTQHYVTGTKPNSSIGDVWFPDTEPYTADFHMSGTMPFSSEDLMKSATVTSSTIDGVTVKLKATMPMSFDYCTTYNIQQPNQSNFVNTFFDGFEDLPTDELGPLYYNGCRRVFLRVYSEILYLTDNPNGAVPMERSAFWYLNFGNAYDNWFQFYGGSRGGKIAVFNFQLWEFNEYVEQLYHLDYRNFLSLYEGEVVSIQNQQLEYQESQETILKDIRDRQNKAYDELMNDEVDSNPYSDFFSNFNDTDHGGISSIVSAPVRLVYSLNNACSPVNFSIFNKNINLPCGTTLFWNKSGVGTFRNVWNVLIGGSIVFGLLRKMFTTIQNMKDPENDKVEVMKL